MTSFIDNNWSGLIINQGEDPYAMGRWNYFTIGRKQKQRFTIITAYRTAKRHPSYVGPTTAIAQQDTILKRQGRHNIRTVCAFIQDMGEFLDDLNEKGHDIMLALDANKEYTEGFKIQQLASEHGLVNMVDHVEYSLSATKPSSNKTIDFVLCFINVLDSVEALGLTPYDLRLGEHRGQYIDLNSRKLLTVNSIDHNKADGRKLSTKYAKATTRYLKNCKEL
jgi:hypothetical protein